MYCETRPRVCQWQSRGHFWQCRGLSLPNQRSGLTMHEHKCGVAYYNTTKHSNVYFWLNPNITKFRKYLFCLPCIEQSLLEAHKGGSGIVTPDNAWQIWFNKINIQWITKFFFQQELRLQGAINLRVYPTRENSVRLYTIHAQVKRNRKLIDMRVRQWWRFCGCTNGLHQVQFNFISSEIKLCLVCVRELLAIPYCATLYSKWNILGTARVQICYPEYSTRYWVLALIKWLWLVTLEMSQMWVICARNVCNWIKYAGTWDIHVSYTSSTPDQKEFAELFATILFIWPQAHFSVKNGLI